MRLSAAGEGRGVGIFQEQRQVVGAGLNGIGADFGKVSSGIDDWQTIDQGVDSRAAVVVVGDEHWPAGGVAIKLEERIGECPARAAGAVEGDGEEVAGLELPEI